VGNAEDLARRQLQQPATKNYDPEKVKKLVEGLVGQLRMANVQTLEMIGVGDGLVVTVAATLLEVAEPGPKREAVRAELISIIDRMRRDIETTPEGSPEVM